MSLCITITTPEGIIIAADSRQSYTNQKQMTRIGSDSAIKIFKLGKLAGVTVAGLAFIKEGENNKNISKFIEEFKSTENTDGLTIQEIAKRLKSFFEEKYQYGSQLEQNSKLVEQDLNRNGCQIVNIDRKKDHIKIKYNTPSGEEVNYLVQVPPLQFIVSGFDNKSEHHNVFIVSVPGELQLKRDSNKKGKEYGADWIGQSDVLSRIVLGFDSRIRILKMYQDAVHSSSEEEIIKQLRNLEYAIQWGTMTMQDAIDFSVLAIETTTAIKRFSDGIRGYPGDIPGVGGPIDVAVITPNEGFEWIAKKDLAVNKTQAVKGLN